MCALSLSMGLTRVLIDSLTSPGCLPSGLAKLPYLAR